jgi:hypothetical protein
MIALLGFLAISPAVLSPAAAWKWADVATSDDSSLFTTSRFGSATAVWPQQATAAPDRAIICGGQDNATLYGDCSVLLPGLNGQPWSLKQVTKSGTLSPRRDFAAIAYQSYLFLYGGQSSTSGYNYKDRSLVYPTVLQIGSWSVLDASFNGDIPTARCGHSAVLNPADSFSWIIFGGSAIADGALLNDLAVLDLRTSGNFSITPTFNFVTSQITIAGTRPSARKYHSMAAYAPASAVFVVGGLQADGAASSEVWRLSVGTTTPGGVWTWTLQSTVYSIPLYGAAMIAVSVTAPSGSSSSSSGSNPPTGGLLVLYGGVTTGGGRVPSSAYLSNGGVITISLVDYNWREPAIAAATSGTGGAGGNGYGGAFLPGAAFLSNMQSVDSTDNGNTRLLVFGGALPPAATTTTTATTTGVFATLEQIGVVSAPPSKNQTLPIVLGSIAVALFLLLGGAGFIWYRRGQAANNSSKAMSNKNATMVPRIKSTSLLGAERAHLLSSPASVFYGGASGGAGLHDTTAMTASTTASGGYNGGYMAAGGPPQGYVYGSPATVRNGGMVKAVDGSFFGNTNTPYSQAAPYADDASGVGGGSDYYETASEVVADTRTKGKRSKRKSSKPAVASEDGDEGANYLPPPSTAVSMVPGSSSSSSAYAYTQRLLHHQFYPPPPISEGLGGDANDGEGFNVATTEEETGIGGDGMDGRATSNDDGAAVTITREDELRF